MPNIENFKRNKNCYISIVGYFIICFINHLKGENLQQLQKNYRTIQMLKVYTSAVTINGHKVGRVQDIRFTDDNSGMLEVSMLIDSDFNFSKNSIAELYESGLIGGKAISIIPAFDGSANTISGDVLKSKIKPGLTESVKSTTLLHYKKKLNQLWLVLTIC